MFNLETERLIITEFNLDMAKDVSENSLDEDTKKFLPDEVFETEEDAKETIEFLMSCYDKQDGPFVYPVLLKDKTNLGYVQLAPIEEGWEIGYHIAKKYTNNGYATEAVKAFLPYMMERVNADEVYGVCIYENIASRKVLEKCNFDLIFDGEGDYQDKKQHICKYLFK
jgi:RimJ/RimL family protein N-acetyltransferase